jgi:hypothetical protein
MRCACHGTSPFSTPAKLWRGFASWNPLAPRSRYSFPYLFTAIIGTPNAFTIYFRAAIRLLISVTPTGFTGQDREV